MSSPTSGAQGTARAVGSSRAGEETILLPILQRLQARFPAIVKNVRGIGLMIGMGLTIPGGDIVKKGHERGLLLNVTHDTVLRFVPPLTVTKAEVDEMIAILGGIFAEVG